MRIGAPNLVEVATVTPTSEDPFWLAENLKHPERCFLPTRTAAVGDQAWVIDHGSAKSVAVWGIINANVETARIQANATDSWGAPSYDSGLLTLGRNPGNGRRNYVLRPTSAQNYRFNRLVIASGTIVDNGAAYYEVGGLHAGVVTAGLSIRWAYRSQRMRPVKDIGPEHKGWEQRLSMGQPRTRVTVKRFSYARNAPVLAGTDALSVWLEVERLWSLSDYALVSFSDTHPGLTWIMRIEQDPEWGIDSHLSESDLQLVEVVR